MVSLEDCHGSYSIVYKAKCGNLPCAVKLLFFQDNDPGIRSKILEERLALTVRPPNIVNFVQQCLGTASDPQSGKTVFPIELMGESLTKFQERSTGSLFYHCFCHDVSHDLAYLHSSNTIIHRDFSANVMLIGNDNRVKVTDYEVSRDMTFLTLVPDCMPPFSAPTQYRRKIDVFSFGVLMVEILRSYGKFTEQEDILFESKCKISPSKMKVLAAQRDQIGTANSQLGSSWLLNSVKKHANEEWDLFISSSSYNEPALQVPSPYMSSVSELRLLSMPDGNHILEKYKMYIALVPWQERDDDTTHFFFPCLSPLQYFPCVVTLPKLQLLKKEETNNIQWDQEEKYFIPQLQLLKKEETNNIQWDQEEKYFVPCVLNNLKKSILPQSIQFQFSHRPKGLFGVLVTPESDEAKYFIPHVLNHVKESMWPLSVLFQFSHRSKGLFGVLVTHLMTPESDEEDSSHAAFTLVKIFESDDDNLSLKLPAHIQVEFCSSHEDRDLSIGEVCSSNVRQVSAKHTSPLQKQDEMSLEEKIIEDTAALLLEHVLICSVVSLLVYLQLVTGLSRFVTALCNLLLLSGDVETNPGPINSSEKADYGDLVIIPDVDAKWEHLGIFLKLDHASLAQIEAKHSNQSRCKREMFRLAVRKGVTWKEVIKGLCDVGLSSIVQNVCAMFDIPLLNGLSTFVLSEKLSVDSVEADCATPTTEVKSFSTSIEFQTFESTRGDLVPEITRDPIMLANAVFSRGIITQENLHELRVISTEHSKAVKLVSLIEATLHEHPHKFEAFTSALRSISTHVALANKVSQLYRFNRVCNKMKITEEQHLDINYLSAELNYSQLLSDNSRIKAAGAANFVDMCSVILADLQARGLGEPYLALLDSFPNTKEVCATLRELCRKQTEPKPGESVLAESLEKRDDVLRKGTIFTAKSPVSSPLHSGENFHARVQSPDMESDPYLSADSSRMSAPHRDDNSEFHSPEAIIPHMSSEELTLRHSVNVMGGVKVATTLKSVENPLSTLNQSSHRNPVVSEPAALSSAQTLSISKIAGGDVSGMVTARDKKREKPVKKDQVKGPKPKLQHDKFGAAMKRWDTVQVDSLLSKEAADVEYLFQPDQQTALMLAAIEGNKDMVRTLLQHGASVVTRDQDGCTALYLAASNGNYEALKILAQQQLADVNIKNKDGEPLLMEPVRKGFSMVTELLVQYGAKVDVESTDGETPLYVAVRKGNYDVVKVLLDSNAEFTKESNKTLRTPLEEALEGDDTEIVRLLMKGVTRVNEKSRELFTCKTRDRVKYLISKGAKINTRNSEEATPLLIHAQQNNSDIVKELIHHRANVDLQDRHGYSALNVAAKNGSLELVQLLVKNGAILDLKESKNGYTALMFAIERGHIRIVRELILAKANANIRNRDGKSSLDLARECGNADVLEILNMQPTVSTGNDPFISILSEYMLGGGRVKKNGASKSSSTSSPPRARAAVALKTPYVPEEDSAHVAEVKKYQKRIADLETRIHDLTILGTMEIADESDLTYMERGRLETEFRKLKESKKKAEQYAVEAKQTAQRLSAENFKLREDLSKERHFNELTRKNMMREVELSIVRKEGHTKTKAIRSEVFDEEVAKRAFLGRQSSSLYHRVKFTGEQIKDLIMEKRVSLDMFHLVIGGLPYSGKTTLVNNIFDLPQLQKPTKSTCDIDFHEAIIHKNKLSGEHDWFEISKLQANIHTIIAALAYFFAKEHQLPILDLKDVKQFDDAEIQRYFETTCSCLESLVRNIDDETKVEKMLSGSLSLMNVFDLGVNRAVYEFMMAVEGKNKHLIFVNVLDLVQSDENTMKRPLNLDDPRYGGKYRESRVSLFRNRTALHHFVSFTEAASHAKPSGSPTSNTLIVGTHADQFNSRSERTEREKEVMDLLKRYDAEMGYTSNASSPSMVIVDATKKDDCKQVRDHLMMLVDSNRDFNVELPVRFIFLRYVLFCTKKVHMSRKEVIEYAKKCGITIESEVDDFLDIFRNCASIISSDDKKEFLYSCVILLPIDFLRDLNKLYCIEDERTIPPELKELVKFGILSERVLRALWQGSDEYMLTWEFFVDVLKNVLLLMDLGAGKFFCPSLRLEHSDGPLRHGSLIISSSAAFTSFSGLQCAFVKHLTSNHKDLRLDEECPFYNCVEFLSKSGDKEGRVTIRFFHDFIEVFVDPSDISPSHADNLYSMLKTDCVAIMNEISQVQYKFCVTCPNSGVKPHFIPFDILDTSAHNLRCTMCKSEVTDVKGVHWVTAAYQGSRRAALKAGDVLDPVNLLKICKEDLSAVTIQEMETLSKKLMVSDEFKAISHAPVDEVLFHVVYSWHCKNLTATKRKLALMLKECGLYKQAVTMDPNLLGHTSNEVTTFSSKEVIILASSWSEDSEELAEVLGMPIPEEEATDTDKCSSMLQQWLDQSEGDRREKLALKFEEKEYHSMASVVSEL